MYAWCDFWSWSVQGQGLAFDDPGGFLPTQDILWYVGDSKQKTGGSYTHEEASPMGLHFIFSAHQTLLGLDVKTRKDLSPSWNPLPVRKPWEQHWRQPGTISWKMTLQRFFQYFYFSSAPFENLCCAVMAFMVHYSIQLYSTVNPIITAPNTSKFTCSPCHVWWLF